RLWERSSGKVIRRLTGCYAAFSPEGALVASGGTDGALQLWGTATGTETRRWQAHGPPVGSVAFSRDGTRLLTTSEEGTAVLWETATGKQVRAVPGFRAALTPDSRRLLAQIVGAKLSLWDAETGREVRGLT